MTARWPALPSLLGEAVQFYACFISYSAKVSVAMTKWFWHEFGARRRVWNGGAHGDAVSQDVKIGRLELQQDLELGLAEAVDVLGRNTLGWMPRLIAKFSLCIPNASKPIGSKTSWPRMAMKRPWISAPVNA